MIKFIAGLATGAVAGSVTTFIIANRKFKKRLAEIEETYQAVAERKKIKVEQLNAGKTDDISSEEDNKEVVESDSPVHEASDDDDDDDEDEDDDYNDYIRQARDYGSTKYPHHITFEDFDKSSNQHMVMYYEADEKAIDTEEGIELDLDNDLGADMGLLEATHFEEAPNGYVYIRNPRTGVDYCIDRASGGFVE